MNGYEFILERINRDGPIRLTITEDEYEYLRGISKRLWEGRYHWNSQTRLLFLAFLRGYTFYRELPENEDQFWANFHAELEINQDLPRTAQYDELEMALKQHPETRSLFRISYGVLRERREFVQTIDAIWGIRRLRVAQLIALFCIFYEGRIDDEDFSSMLLRRRLNALDENTLQQLHAYNTVFVALFDAVEYILERRIPLRQPEQIIQSLERAGIELSQPNCIRFFANKSDQALPEIISRLSGIPRRLQSKTSQKRKLAVRELQRKDVSLETIKVLGWSESGRSLEWQLSSNPLLVENQTQTGYVKLPDGRFATFTWKPFRTAEGTAGHQQIAISLDEVIIYVELASLPMSIRWRQDQKPLSIDWVEQLENLSVQLFSNPYQRPDGWILRYSVASLPHKFCDHPRDLRPLALDMLLVEVCLNRTTNLWMPLARLSLKIAPEIAACGIEGGVCKILARGPRQATLTIREFEPHSGQQVSQQHLSISRVSYANGNS